MLLGLLQGSVGFGIQQAMQTVGNQGLGFISGGRRGVTGVPRRQMYSAISLVMVGAAVMVYANYLTGAR